MISLNNYLSLFPSPFSPWTPPLMSWKLFIRCVALPGVTEELWTEENVRALDQFIVDTSVTTMLVYVDTENRLRVEYSMPLPVQHTFLSI